MNCLITGTSGYVGKTLAKHLTECGHRVLEIHGRKDFNEIERLIKEVPLDLVIHAGCTTEFVNIYQSESQSPNCTNTKLLVDLLNQLPQKPYFILIGAAGVFGVTSGEKELDETSTGPDSFWFRDYDRTQYIHDKKTQTKIVSEYQGPSTILCLTTVFGKGMAEATISFYRNLKSKHIIPVPAGGTSYLGENDLLNAVDVCIKEKPPGEYIVSSGNISFRNLFLKTREGTAQQPIAIKIPKFFIFVFFLAHRIIPRFNVLISTFGNKFYSSRKLQQETSWRPKDEIGKIFEAIL